MDSAIDLLKKYGNADVRDVPLFIINSVLRNAGVQVPKELLGELKSAQASLSEKMTVMEFIKKNESLAERVMCLVNGTNPTNSVADNGYECPNCLWTSFGTNVCPHCRS